MRRAFFFSVVVLAACNGAYGAEPPGQTPADAQAPDATTPDAATDAPEPCALDCAHGHRQCTASGCTLVCDTGFADCDGDPSNGCERNLQLDGAACGVCAHDCLGGACAAGQCQPVKVLTEKDGLRGLALDGSGVYMVVPGTPGRIQRCPLVGACTPFVVASSLDQPDQLAVGATNVYVTGAAALTTGKVWRCGKAGCGAQAEVMTSAVPLAQAIAVDAVNVYFASRTGNGDFVKRCSLSGCGPGEPALVGSGFSIVDAIATDGANVWVSEQKDIARCPVGGCAGAPPKYAAGFTSASQIIVDGGEVFWADQAFAGSNGAVLRCSAATCVQPAVLAAPIDLPDGWLALDATSVYVPSRQALLRVPRAGGPAKTMAQLTGLRVRGIAVGPQAVYLTTGDGAAAGTLLRVAK